MNALEWVLAALTVEDQIRLLQSFCAQGGHLTVQNAGKLRKLTVADGTLRYLDAPQEPVDAHALILRQIRLS